jgi:hypothetical protein
MKITNYPSKKRINESKKNDDPLLICISFDGTNVIIGNIDDCFEHHILLKKAGFPEKLIEECYRIILNKKEASWTYVCPGNYLNIPNRELRLRKYYENGIDEITRILKILKYDVPIDIPQRYRRHFDALKDNGNNFPNNSH